MVKIGKVIEYDGRFGIIRTIESKYNFRKKDISSKEIEIGDMVEFREEKKDPDILLAKNIKKTSEIY